VKAAPLWGGFFTGYVPGIVEQHFARAGQNIEELE
jgi:hypothetical protein